MAITGSITELPLPDVLTTLRNQHGRLVFTELGPVSNVEIYLVPNFICGVFVSGVCITDEAIILEKLIGITASVRGRFHFEALPAEMINQRVRISIDGLNLSVVTMADEIAWRQSDFILPAKMVILARRDAVFAEAILTSFFARAFDLFDTGIDAQQLAVKMQVSMTQAQFYILKFLEAGAVKLGMPQGGYRHLPSPIVVQSSRLKLMSTQRIRVRN